MKEPEIKFFDWVKILCLFASFICILVIFIKTGILRQYDLSPYWFILTPVFAVIAAIPYREEYWQEYKREKEWEEKHKDGDTTIHFTVKIS